MIIEILEHSLLLVVGGIIYGLFLYNVLPIMSIRVGAKDVTVIVASVAVLFWASFLIPRAIIFSDVLVVDIVTYIAISTFSYLVFMGGFVVSLLAIGWYRRRRRPPR